MLKWLRNLFAPQRNDMHTRSFRNARARNNVRARYDAALTSPDNMRHWANADALSPNAANNRWVRRTLRIRSRYEVANNSYARGIVLTLANYCVGTGPRLQMLLPNHDLNRFIEDEFARWAEAVRLAEKLRTMRMAKCQDGEAFALLVNNPKLDTPVQLDLRLIEADQVTTPGISDMVPPLVDGIVLDDHGNPIEYHVLKEHPGDLLLIYGWNYTRVPAAHMIHWYRVDRPGQMRGIPELTPALPLFAQLRRYTLAVIAAAETAADFAGVLYTDAPASEVVDDTSMFQPVPLEKRALLTLPGDWKIEQLEAHQPTTTYSDFKREILNEIARCLNLPYNIAACDSSDYNYASGRLDHQTFGRALLVERADLETVVLNRVLNAWLDEALLIPGYLPADLQPITSWPHQWFWDGQDHIDPVKEAQAQAVRLESGTTTLAYEYAKLGMDWEEALRQRAKELALMRELGLLPDKSKSPTKARSKSDDVTRSSSQNGDEPDEEDDEDAEAEEDVSDEDDYEAEVYNERAPKE